MLFKLDFATRVNRSNKFMDKALELLWRLPNDGLSSFTLRYETVRVLVRRMKYTLLLVVKASDGRVRQKITTEKSAMVVSWLETIGSFRVM